MSDQSVDATALPPREQSSSISSGGKNHRRQRGGDDRTMGTPTDVAMVMDRPSATTSSNRSSSDGSSSMTTSSSDTGDGGGSPTDADGGVPPVTTYASIASPVDPPVQQVGGTSGRRGDDEAHPMEDAPAVLRDVSEAAVLPVTPSTDEHRQQGHVDGRRALQQDGHDDCHRQEQHPFEAEDSAEAVHVSVNPDLQSLVSGALVSQRYSRSSSRSSYHSTPPRRLSLPPRSDTSSSLSSAGRSLFDDSVAPPRDDADEGSMADEDPAAMVGKASGRGAIDARTDDVRATEHGNSPDGLTAVPTTTAAAGADAAASHGYVSGGQEETPLPAALNAVLQGLAVDASGTSVERRRFQRKQGCDAAHVHHGTTSSSAVGGTASLQEERAFLAEYIFRTTYPPHATTSDASLGAILEAENARHTALLHQQAALDDCLERMTEFMVWYRLEWDRKSRSAVLLTDAFADVPPAKIRFDVSPQRSIAGRGDLAPHDDHAHPAAAARHDGMAKHSPTAAVSSSPICLAPSGRSDEGEVEAIRRTSIPPLSSFSPVRHRSTSLFSDVDGVVEGSLSTNPIRNSGSSRDDFHQADHASGAPVAAAAPTAALHGGRRGSINDSLSLSKNSPTQYDVQVPSMGSGALQSPNASGVYGSALSPSLHTASFRHPSKLVDEASALLYGLHQRTGGGGSPYSADQRNPLTVSDSCNGAFSPELRMSWVLSNSEEPLHLEIVGEQPAHQSDKHDSPTDGQFKPTPRRDGHRHQDESPQHRHQTGGKQPSPATRRAMPNEQQLKGKMLDQLLEAAEAAKRSLRTVTPKLIGMASRLMQLEQDAAALRLENARLETSHVECAQQLIELRLRVGYRDEAELNQQLHDTMLQHQSTLYQLKTETKTWKQATKQAVLLQATEARRIALLEDKIVLQAEHRLRGGDTAQRLVAMANRQRRLMDKLTLCLDAETLRSRREIELLESHRLLADKSLPSRVQESPQRRSAAGSGHRRVADRNANVWGRLTASLPARFEAEVSESTSRHPPLNHPYASPLANRKKVGDVWGRMRLNE